SQLPVAHRANDRRRQGHQRGAEPAVDLLRSLSRRLAWHVEEEPPVDRLLRRKRLKPDQIGREPQWGPAMVEMEFSSDLAVAVAVGSVGELQRYVGRLSGAEKQARALTQHTRRPFGPDCGRQQAVQDHPLVVPGGGSSCLLEELSLGHAVLAQPRSWAMY